MFLPKKYVKYTVDIQAYTQVTIGIGALIYAEIVKKRYRKQNEVQALISLDSQESLFTFFLIAQICMIVVGSFGLIVSYWKRIWSLLLYNIANIGMFLSFLVLMILLYQSAGQMNDSYYISGCSETNNQLYELNQVQEWGQSLLCSNKCICYFNGNFPSGWPQNQYFCQNDTYAISVQQCSSEYNYGVAILEELEKQYSCSGWCSYYPYLIFYDINHWTSGKSCLQAVLDEVQHQVVVFGDLAAGLMGLMIIILSLTFCACFRPSEKDMDYYQEIGLIDKA